MFHSAGRLCLFLAVAAVLGMGMSRDVKTASAQNEARWSLGGQISDTTKRDRYPFTFRRGDLVTARMNRLSGDLDPYLTIYHAYGRRLSYDDDGGGNQNALIQSIQIPEDGDYSLVARSWHDCCTGNYELIVTVYNPISDASNPDCSYESADGQCQCVAYFQHRFGVCPPSGRAADLANPGADGLTFLDKQGFHQVTNIPRAGNVVVIKPNRPHLTYGDGHVGVVETLPRLEDGYWVMSIRGANQLEACAPPCGSSESRCDNVSLWQNVRIKAWDDEDATFWTR